MLTVICNATDTFDIGMLPCSTHVLDVTAIATGNLTGIDEEVFPLSIACSAVGIPELNGVNSLMIFPNPVSTELHVNSLAERDSFCEITILNLLSEVVYRSSSSKTRQTLDVSELPVGMYVLKLKGPGGVMVRKLIKE